MPTLAAASLVGVALRGACEPSCVAVRFVHPLHWEPRNGFSEASLAKQKGSHKATLFVLAGALGLEPRTNGFGDRDSTN